MAAKNRRSCGLDQKQMIGSKILLRVAELILKKWSKMEMFQNQLSIWNFQVDVSKPQ